jgi:hypothetical protein
MPLVFTLVPTYRLRIQNDLVACLVKDAPNVGSYLEIWNWRISGSNSSRSLVRRTGIDDFIFLSPTSLLLVDPGGNFEVWDFTDPGSIHSLSNDIPTLRATFSLPPLKENNLYWYTSLNANPSPGYTPTSTTRPWYSHPEERILGCAIGTTDPASHVGPQATHNFDCFIFFVSLRTFLDPPLPTGADPPTHAWDKWAHKTRWFRDSVNINWQHSIYGYRVIDWVGAPNERRRLRIRDFNPNAAGMHTHAEASVIPSSGIFAKDLESSLPYREVLSEDTFDAGGRIRDLMIDEDRILFLKVCCGFEWVALLTD